MTELHVINNMLQKVHIMQCFVLAQADIVLLNTRTDIKYVNSFNI